VVSSSSHEQNSILVDCDIVLLLLMEEGEGEDGDGDDGGRVTSIFVMTLSRHFSFRDKASPLGEIDWAQALT